MLKIVLDKMQKCDNYKTLYALEDELLKCGLAIVLTENGTRTLCRIENGRPVHHRVFDDYIFIESKEEFRPIPVHSLNTIINFIKEHASDNQLLPSVVSRIQQYCLYGKPIRIANENSVADDQNIIGISKLLG